MKGLNHFKKLKFKHFFLSKYKSKQSYPNKMNTYLPKRVDNDIVFYVSNNEFIKMKLDSENIEIIQKLFIQSLPLHTISEIHKLKITQIAGEDYIVFSLFDGAMGCKMNRDTILFYSETHIDSGFTITMKITKKLIKIFKSFI